MPYSAPGPFLGAQTASAYQVSRSLRFRSSASAYLSRTFSNAATNNLKGTLSFWVKRGTLGAQVDIISCYNGSSSASTDLYFNSSNQLQFDFGNTAVNSLITTQVFRDPSAWYHIVLAVDTTQATASNRCLLYVNGTQITAFSSATYPAQNTVFQIVSINANNRIGTNWNNSAVFFDGYLAEVNFIDGQALTPSSFGQSNALTGVWEPKQYTGTYGNNGFYLPFSLSASSTYAGSFNGSSQLLSVPDNAVFTMGSGDFTIEAWVNFAASGRQIVVYQGDAAGSDASISFYLERSSLNYLRMYVASGATGYSSIGTTVIPTNQWVHIAGVRNGNNLLCYLNGVQQATLSVTGVTINDSIYPVQISGYGNGAATGLIVNGSISNVRIVKGTAVYTANFTPPSQALTAISGTSLLCLQSSSVTQDNSGNSLTITNVGTVTTSTATPFVANVTADASGNNNGWIPANINASSSGTTYDSMIDSPTNYADGGNGRGNYATLNPNGKLYTNAVSTVSNGNLTATGSGTILQGTMATSTSGKYYFEMTATTVSGTDDWVGFILASATGSSGVSSNTLLYRSNGQKYFSSWANYGNSWSSGNVIGCAIDLDNGAVYFAINNTWQTSGVPTSGSAKTGAAFTDSTVQISGVSWGIIQSLGGVAQQDFNFGQRPFTYTPPSGFSALNTQNLPAPALTPSP